MVAMPAHGPAGDRTQRAALTFRLLLLMALAVGLMSLGTGAAGVPLFQVARDLMSGEGLSHRDQVILMNIRLPRLAMGMLVGAALAVSGALMQGLFRNPLADPGIVGVGAGAGLGAVTAIVLGGVLPAGLAAVVGVHLVPFAAFLGGWAATLLLYRIATQGGQTQVATLLLAGIALGALAGALTGILVYLADDTQLRNLTFWGMGSIAGASWAKIGLGLPLILPVLVFAPLLARALNALALGEAQAGHIGIEVQRVKRLAILGVAAAAGASVAIAGGIGFVGRDRLHRHRGAASAASGNGAGPPLAAAQCRAAGGHAAGARRYGSAHAGRPRGTADRHRDGRHRGAGIPVDPAATPRAGGAVMLAARDLTAELARRPVLHGITLDCAPGTLTAIVGPNGSGKTTLLRALTGDLRYGGSARLNGVEIARAGAATLAHLRGVLAQATHLSFPFTVLEVVRLGLTNGGGDARAMAALAEVGLHGHAGRVVQELSGGEQARVHLARVLSQVWEPVTPQGPRWLFLDEPVAALDIGQQLTVMRLARRYAHQGGGVVAVMHDLNLSSMFADRVALMQDGRLLAYGTPAQVLTDIHLSRAYGCALRVNTVPQVGGPWLVPQSVGA